MKWWGQRRREARCRNHGHDVDEFAASRLVAYSGYNPDEVRLTCRRCRKVMTWSEFLVSRYGG